LGIIAIIGLTLCASAIYASFGNNQAKEAAAVAISAEETSPNITPAPAEMPQQVALILPSPAHNTSTIQQSPAGEDEKPAHAEELTVAVTTAPTEAARASTATNDTDSAEPQTTEHPDNLLASITQTVIEDEATISIDEGTWLEEKVKSGDNLALIFSRLKLSANLLHRIVNSSKEAKSLANIRPGEAIRVRVDKQGEMLELVHKQSAIRSLQILPNEEGFSAQTHDRSLEKRIATASGTITNSLYLSAQRAGLSDTLTMELANIFGWDIDFALEIRAGDQFSLIYEEEYLDGKKYRNGPILAAEFTNQGKVFRAIRFEDEEGYSSYFSPDGQSMRKAFLRAPVDFRRISSRFTKARYHPVLGKKRPHKGVDYSAATGTPIKAAGDGRVIFRGTKGGYGRTVIVRHGSQYTTLYAHMSKYRSNVGNGTRVRQGQVIGYVGKSGLATGPHLHYEFRVNGVHRNPLTIKLPAAEPLAKKYQSQFASTSAPLLSQLDLISKTMVADAR
jgi:murein DD-endopeptidase MepM/ murein hydrolase activator NlpD